MLMSEMDAEDAAREILKHEKMNDWRNVIGSDELKLQAQSELASYIRFVRKAKVLTHSVKATRGRKAGCVASSKYPGVFVHQAIVISDGKKKVEVLHPELIGVEYERDKVLGFSIDIKLLGFWEKIPQISTKAESKILKAVPEVIRLYKECESIRNTLTQEEVENVAEEYVEKNQAKAKPQIIKKLGTFLAEFDLKDEDPGMLLQIMKFVSRDDFGQMKQFLLYCRNNKGDINFLTLKEISEAQDLARAIEVTKS